jgi:hypothetical protein
MPKSHLQNIEKELAELTMEQLHAVLAFIMEASDDEFKSVIARREAAEYVMKEFRGRIGGEISELHDWIHSAIGSYSGNLRNVDNRTSIRAEHGQSDELIASGV